MSSSQRIPHKRVLFHVGGVMVTSLALAICRILTGATAPYFYGSILLRALKSKIIVVLTYLFNKNCASN